MSASKHPEAHSNGATVTDHLARPGPQYWSWRCLTCSEPCSDHIGVVRFAARKLVRRGWWARTGFPILSMAGGGAFSIAIGVAHHNGLPLALGGFWLGCAWTAALIEWVER